MPSSVRRYRLFFVSLSLVLFAVGSLAGREIEISARVDRDQIAIDEVITFTIELQGATDFPTIPPPSGNDFVVVGGPSQSSNIQIVNGAMTASKSVTWRLAPTRAGKLQIEPITLRVGRQTYQTPALTVQVQPAARSTPSRSMPQAPSRQPGQPPPLGIFLRATPSKTTLYKGEELVINYDLYYQNVRTYARQKLPAAQGFWVEEFPAANNPTVTTEEVDGVVYKKARIQRLALFPTTTGELQIDPMVIECEVLVPRQRRRSQFDDFFSDPFFSDSFFGQSRQEQIESNRLTIQVKPLPIEGRPPSFSGCVGQYGLRSRIDTLVIVQDQALTLRYTLSGSGNIKAAQLPAFDFPAACEVFEPKITRYTVRSAGSISGRVEYEYVLIPRRTGELLIPAFPVAYFDPLTQRYRTLTTQPFRVTVLPPKEMGVATTSAWRKEEIALLGQDIRFINRQAGEWRRIGATVWQEIWFWLFNSFALAIIAATAAYRWWSDRLTADHLWARRLRAMSIAQNRLRAAAAARSEAHWEAFWGALDQTLGGYIADRLGLPITSLSPGEVQHRLSERRIAPALVAEICALLRQIETTRFTPQPLTSEQSLASELAVRQLLQRLGRVI